jgi:hypothetical protein
MRRPRVLSGGLGWRRVCGPATRREGLLRNSARANGKTAPPGTVWVSSRPSYVNFSVLSVSHAIAAVPTGTFRWYIYARRCDAVAGGGLVAPLVCVGGAACAIFNPLAQCTCWFNVRIIVLPGDVDANRN